MRKLTNKKFKNLTDVNDVDYSQFHKTLPKSSLQMHWISVRFYEMGDISESMKYFIEKNI